VHFLVQRAAQGDVDFLKAAAHAEHRHAAPDRTARQRQGHLVARRVGRRVRVAQRGAVAGRVDVAGRAGQEQAVQQIEHAVRVGGVGEGAARPVDQRRHDERQRAGAGGDRVEIFVADTMDGVGGSAVEVGHDPDHRFCINAHAEPLQFRRRARHSACATPGLR
jgi:glutamine synthetase